MTARHSVAVGGGACRIAAGSGLSEAQRQLAYLAGLVHDIGKLAFPDRILKRDVRLSDDDWRTIRSHPGRGATVLGGIEGCEMIAGIVLAHHERVDGARYPPGLRGDEIPAIARMIAVADTYDAMTARNSCRDPLPQAKAVDELERVAGTQLDAGFVEVFTDALARDARTPPRFTHFLRTEPASA